MSDPAGDERTERVADAADASGDDYGGLLGAYPYAFRATESWLFRSYVLVGGLVTALVVLLFLLALPVWVSETLGAPADITLSRAFLFLVGVMVFAPLAAPVLLVARHHRRTGSDGRYDAVLAACGYLFVVGLYAGLVVGSPDQVVSGQLRVLGAVPPLVAVGLLVAAHRRLR